MKVNDSVAWQWGSGLAQGTIIEVRTERIEITSKGKKVVRNGTPDNPALVIRHESGNKVLKLQSEVQKTNE